MHRTPPNTRIRLALILLVGVVACLIVFYVTYEAKPRVTRASPRVPTPEEIRYEAFRAQTHAFAQVRRAQELDREQLEATDANDQSTFERLMEHQTSENGSEIASIGIRLMYHFWNSDEPRRGLSYGWETVQAIRSIYGDQSFETHYILGRFVRGFWIPRKIYDLDLEVLLPILDETYELAWAQGPSPTSEGFDALDDLCRFFRDVASTTESLVGDLIKSGALDMAAERLEYAQIVLDRPWFGSLCENSRDWKTERTLKHLADAEAALDAARAEEGD